MTIIIWAVFITILIITIIDYSCDISQISKFIKFSAFKSFYEINKDAWGLEYGWVTYKPRDSYVHTSPIMLKFHFIDWMRYKKWKRDNNRHKKRAQDVEEMVDLINSVKRDIAKYEAHNQQSLQKRIEEIWDR